MEAHKRSRNIAFRRVTAVAGLYDPLVPPSLLPEGIWYLAAPAGRGRPDTRGTGEAHLAHVGEMKSTLAGVVHTHERVRKKKHSPDHDAVRSTRRGFRNEVRVEPCR
ncbi:hypothetical protein PG996_001558 [Apiospora saccharicola]|uniref:Uncharacterized protein n=1 Tax=Apiospora saccharicola TaxID=335842 RepID=A0ABR1WIE6_9PEZI